MKRKIVMGVAVLFAIGGLLMWRAYARTSKVALASSPKPVTTVLAEAATFRATRMYVGTLEPWVSANVGPQLVSAYVDTVLVRPGAQVKRHEVLATLDCRNASAASKAVAMQARSVDAKQRAVADEAARTQGLLAGGFVSPNEAEQKNAQSAEQAAQLLETQAQLAKTTLEVDDCILRAPFDGEVATRTVDPGAFVRPGTAIVSVIDRATVRLSADAPEIDFAFVAVGTPVRIHALSLNKDFAGKVARRAPAADPATRTVHFEVDLADPTREVPVGTTAEATIDVGEPTPATRIPLVTASVRNDKAVLFTVDNETARQRTIAVLGEQGGDLFVATELTPGTRVISEGRALLNDGDKVEP